MASRSRRETIEAMGLGPLWVSRDAPARGDRAAPERIAERAAPTSPAFDEAARAARIGMLSTDALEAEVATCVACRLCETRTRTVFGSGPARPAWLVVGEAPGADEDAVGEPFVGQAGRLLDAMLHAAGFSRRTDTFIANTVKCRPPGNRDPSADELARCRPFLSRQIALLDPRVVLAVGRVAANALLGTEESVGQLRGRVHALDVDGRSRSLVVTYHPAYLLRSPQDKAKAWADLCLARRTLREQSVDTPA